MLVGCLKGVACGADHLTKIDLSNVVAILQAGIADTGPLATTDLSMMDCLAKGARWADLWAAVISAWYDSGLTISEVKTLEELRARIQSALRQQRVVSWI